MIGTRVRNTDRQGCRMHPEIEKLQRDVANKQRAWVESWQRLTASNARFLTANPASVSYHAISSEHTRLFEDWVKKNRELEKSVQAMHRKALEVYNVPKDNPFWALAGEDAGDGESG